MVPNIYVMINARFTTWISLKAHGSKVMNGDPTPYLWRLREPVDRSHIAMEARSHARQRTKLLLSKNLLALGLRLDHQKSVCF